MHGGRELLTEGSEGSEDKAIQKNFTEGRKGHEGLLHFMKEHQQRVVAERDELKDRLTKLKDFIGNNPIFSDLPKDEQERLRAQSGAMALYASILDRRILSFPA